jgi:HEAT repeat protein
MTPDERIRDLLAEPDEERRFSLLSDFVTSDSAAALLVGQRLLGSGKAKERELGADLLGQVATVDRNASGRIAEMLLPRLEAEGDPSALQAVGVALGHAGDIRARRALLGLADHPDASVRFAVAFALPSVGLDDEALAALRRLSRDSDDNVRDWATFGLAESEADDAQTRDALAERADDPDDDTRAEGIFGLARRGDSRARMLVDRELRRPYVGALIERAREELDQVKPSKAGVRRRRDRGGGRQSIDS